MTSAVVARNLKKTHTGRDGTVEAVRGVDLYIAPGEVAGIDVSANPNAVRRKILARPGHHWCAHALPHHPGNPHLRLSDPWPTRLRA